MRIQTVCSTLRYPLSLPAEPTGTVLEQPYFAEISSLGNRHPVTRNLPGSNTEPPVLEPMVPSRRRHTIRRAHRKCRGPDNRPLLILNREGEGRVALMLSDHAWLWARGFEGGGPHVPLLRRLSHWLMKEPDLEEEALRIKARDGSLQIERQTLSEESENRIVEISQRQTGNRDPTGKRQGHVGGSNRHPRAWHPCRGRWRTPRPQPCRPGQSARIHRCPIDYGSSCCPR